MSDGNPSLTNAKLRSFRLSTTSTTSADTLPPSEFSLSYNNRSTPSSSLTTPIDPSFTPLLPSEYLKVLPSSSPSPLSHYKDLPPKPLPSPLPSESDLLDMIMTLQSINQSMKLLNTTISDLSEDMVFIETLLMTREVLVQDLAGLPASVDALAQDKPPRSPSTSRYLRNLYQKLAQTSISYTQTAQAYIQS